MRVGIATIGSRGDVQPFLALAVALARAGHQVRLATCRPFRALVESYPGVEFAPLGGDIKEIVGDAGRAALLDAQSSPWRAFGALRRFVGPLVRQGLDELPAALEGVDVVVGQLLAPGAVHWAEKHGLPYFEASYDPVFPTSAFPHPGAPVGTRPGLASWLTYVGAEQVFWQAFRPDVNAFRRRLGLTNAPFLGPTMRAAHRPPHLLGYSGALVPRPADWPDSACVTGAWLLDAPASWTPPAALAAFLEAGPRPVFVGFGSMTVEDPDAMSALCVRALRRAGLRAVVSTGWGALGPVEGPDLFTIGDVPHAWLFPRTAAVVHHGGASTTAEGLRAGVPQLVVPFLSDQPFWGERVERAGVGPKAIPIREIDEEGLYRALVALTDPAMRERAARLGEESRREPGAAAAVVAMERQLLVPQREARAAGGAS
jgi:sterol 3beta-glucosyltransferase